ncbi:MAG TPA: hypothetical protein VFD33_00750 [Bacillota bacterium]|nr:hypothetical protein [Bacillota bacterium]
MSLNQAQKNPTLQNFIKAMGSVFTGVSKPLYYIFLALLVVTSFFVIAMLVLSILVLFASVIIGLAFFIALAVTIPSGFVLEKVGTIGWGILLSGIFSLLAYLLNRLKKHTIVWSARAAQGIRLKAGLGQGPKGGRLETGGFRRIFYLPLIAILIGAILFGISGLPTRLFLIYAGGKPSNVGLVTETYLPDLVDEISIKGEHSSVKLDLSNTDKIEVSLETTDWLDYDLDLSEGIISYTERSNGRLPLFELVKLHGSAAGITISLPKDYIPLLVDIESVGGGLDIAGMPLNINAITKTGSISLNTRGSLGEYTIQASTDKGTISVAEDLRPDNRQGGDNILYYKAPGDKMIRLVSVKGDITID